MDARFDEGSISNFDTDRVSHDLRSRKMLSNDEVDKWWVHNKTEFVEFCIILSGWESISRYVLFFKQWKEFSFTHAFLLYRMCTTVNCRTIHQDDEMALLAVCFSSLFLSLLLSFANEGWARQLSRRYYICMYVNN